MDGRFRVGGVPESQCIGSMQHYGGRVLFEEGRSVGYVTKIGVHRKAIME